MTHFHLTDQSYLVGDHYRDDARLNARARLHQRFGTGSQQWMPWVFDHLRIPAGGSVLEVGCGPGDLWVSNAERIAADWHITLSDLSPGMLARAQQRLSAYHAQMRFASFDVQEIPYEDGTFDVVIANHMLYHVPDIERALEEIARVLRADGRLVAATNGKEHMRALRNYARQLAPDTQMISAAARFGLENGMAILAPHFAAVKLHRYDSDLRITEVQPLVDYILSMSYSDRAAPELKSLVTLLVTQEMEQRGEIYIGRASGLFEAEK
jgi:SAM-dependent methyltransferase